MYEQFLESTEGLTNSQKKKIFRLRLQIDFDFLVDLSEGHTAMPKCNVNEERVNFYFNHFRNIWCTKYLDSVQSSKVHDCRQFGFGFSLLGLDARSSMLQMRR